MVPSGALVTPHSERLIQLLLTKNTRRSISTVGHPKQTTVSRWIRRFVDKCQPLRRNTLASLTGSEFRREDSIGLSKTPLYASGEVSVKELQETALYNRHGEEILGECHLPTRLEDGNDSWKAPVTISFLPTLESSVPTGHSSDPLNRQKWANEYFFAEPNVHAAPIVSGGRWWFDSTSHSDLDVWFQQGEAQPKSWVERLKERVQNVYRDLLGLSSSPAKPTSHHRHGNNVRGVHGGPPRPIQRPQNDEAANSKANHKSRHIKPIHHDDKRKQKPREQKADTKMTTEELKIALSKPHSNPEEGNDPDQKPRKKRRRKPVDYPKHLSLSECLERYNAKDPNLIRGVIRVLPARGAMSFCTCDRGTQAKDVIVKRVRDRNRAISGQTVFVELLPPDEEDKEDKDDTQTVPEPVEVENDDHDESWWHDDPVQMSLWAPTVQIKRNTSIPKGWSPKDGKESLHRFGRVVCVVPPKEIGSEINPTQKTPTAFRNIVGTLSHLQGRLTLLTPSDRSLPQFRLSRADSEAFKDTPKDTMISAKYAYGSWQRTYKWPPCTDIVQLGVSSNVQDETKALLIANQVDHGEFPAEVLQECQDVVASGEYTSGGTTGWKPTAEMLKGRRDYREHRIFTIDPTTAKDLDDALHITELDNGQIEIGVHIADVSYFMKPDSNLDFESQRRCTTIYLVDQTIPMLPGPLSEVACSLNEDVERLAFSCVWRMNKDGSLVEGHDVWYGRTVIKSCARLDYSTAQNIIEKKVANGEFELDENLWPESRRPTGGHTTEQVAADVRLMHEVARARRRLRYRNGAISLDAVKLTFELGADGETPVLCEPYPIRDSNRLIEEYMLLANYLVAQRLITHCGGRALLRSHDPPSRQGIERVAEAAKATIGFQIDTKNSESLQRSLSRLGRECDDELVLQCVTEMLKSPMRAATYIAAGTKKADAWSHFALNIPYYTHFTSPIRRYADVMVHRLLQATLEEPDAMDKFPLTVDEIRTITQMCNKKKEGSRMAQDRSDVVFLALYLKENPAKSQLGVVVSVGQKTFTVFVPSLGISTLVFLEEHQSWIHAEPLEEEGIGRTIRLERTASHNGEEWKELNIESFTKVRVTCKCQERTPINVGLELEGPWEETPESSESQEALLGAKVAAA